MTNLRVSEHNLSVLLSEPLHNTAIWFQFHRNCTILKATGLLTMKTDARMIMCPLEDEPHHDKTGLCHMRITMAQISLHIHAV